ncbi:MAG: hypothetical protein F6K11_02330 [Leptolyngbya sp. SIO3F4]|nr:hypothetical protein [Leptolyngbya sp. SIO3F4]
MVALPKTRKPMILNESDMQLAKDSSRILATHVSSQQATQRIKLANEDGSAQEVILSHRIN